MRERTVQNGDVQLRVIEEVPEGGPQEGRPPVLLVHGWPETSHSWRHQLPALAAAGWHAMAMDLRGFGFSSSPDDLAEFRMDRIASDVLAVIDSVGADQAVLFGHDWGSMVVWQTGQLHPERCAGVVGMSVPFMQWPMRPTQAFELASGGGFFYILYFQPPGIAEQELERDVRQTLRRTYWSASGAAAASGELKPMTSFPREGTGWNDVMVEPTQPMPWLTDADLDEFVRAYEHSGFRGGLNFYRSFDANWELLKDVPASRLSMPTGFIGGKLDGVVVGGMAAIDAHPQVLPDYRGTWLIDGAGHWVQQESPEESNAAMLEFLAGL